MLVRSFESATKGMIALTEFLDNTAMNLANVNTTGYKKSEFKYGEFARSVYLPQEVDADKVEAKLEHGVLNIKAPKLEKEKETVKKISVK